MRTSSARWALLLLPLSLIPQAHSHSLNAVVGSEARIKLENTYLAPRDEKSLRDAVKFDVGTKDAPVDGKDGKPHAGPFVDPLPEKGHKSSSSISSSSNDASKTLPEDSVMNDPTRKAPKKGTTGTEGGVSEKERTRKAQEIETGELHMKKPEPPKEPLPAHNAETQGIAASTKSKTTQRSKDDETSSKDKAEDKGTAGLRKPDNLPDTPHNIPHPKPPSGASQDHGISSKSSVDSDSEDEYMHSDSDLIPWDALMGSFSSIAASEIGDKTFIVAALMAMRHPRLQVFTAAFSALLIMTVLSAVTGHAVGSLISKSWASVLAALLFLVFGAKSLKEGFDMDPDQGVGEEMREVQAELEEKEVDIARAERGRQSSTSAYAMESGRLRSDSEDKKASSSPLWAPKGHQTSSPARLFAGIKNLLGLVLSPAWVETFSMTFVGELGDRSQIATVAMAAGQEYLWVMVGATLGHFVCTAVAVLGGSVLAGRITMRKVTLIGGAIFIVFGLFTLYEATTFFY